MDTRSHYHAQAERDMSAEQTATIAYLAGDGYWTIDGVLPDGDLMIYCDTGRGTYYRVPRNGEAYKITERSVYVPSSAHA